MKKLSKLLLFSLLIILNMGQMQGQTIETNLDQVDLMKQFVGKWKGEFGDNSIFMSENKPFANGIISNSYITVDGKIIETVVQLFGYDKEADKFIIAELIFYLSI